MRQTTNPTRIMTSTSTPPPIKAYSMVEDRPEEVEGVELAAAAVDAVTVTAFGEVA